MKALEIIKINFDKPYFIMMGRENFIKQVYYRNEGIIRDYIYLGIIDKKGNYIADYEEYLEGDTLISHKRRLKLLSNQFRKQADFDFKEKNNE